MDKSCLEDLQENGQIVFCNTHKKQIGIILMTMPVMFFPFLTFLYTIYAFVQCCKCLLQCCVRNIRLANILSHQPFIMEVQF